MKPAVYVKSQKYQSTGRGHQWELTDKEATELVTGNCYYCGDSPFKGCGSIDRVDNKKGYLRDNCVPCCGYCNMMKGTLPREEFLNRVEKIHAHQAKNPNTREKK